MNLYATAPTSAKTAAVCASITGNSKAAANATTPIASHNSEPNNTTTTATGRLKLKTAAAVKAERTKPSPQLTRLPRSLNPACCKRLLTAVACTKTPGIVGLINFCGGGGGEARQRSRS